MLDLPALISTAGYWDRDRAATLQQPHNRTTTLPEQRKVPFSNAYLKLKMAFCTYLHTVIIFLNVLHHICNHGNLVIQTTEQQGSVIFPKAFNKVLE